MFSPIMICLVYPIIISIILSLVMLFLESVFEKYKTISNIFGFLSIISVILLIPSMLLCDYKNNKYIDKIKLETEMSYYDTDKITALEDNLLSQSDLSSTRYVSRMTVNSDIYYCFVILNSDGSKSIKKIKNNSNVKIYESDNTEYKVEYYDEVYTNDYYIKYINDGEAIKSNYAKVNFYIPKNSVTNQFNVDLKN